jgi:hypothetical protein
MILKQEQKTGIKYLRVARMRSDTLLLPRHVPSKCFVNGEYDMSPTTECMAAEKKKAMAEVVAHFGGAMVAAEAKGVGWENTPGGTDWFTWGSRTRMLEGLFKTIEWLQEHPDYTESWNLNICGGAVEHEMMENGTFPKNSVNIADGATIGLWTELLRLGTTYTSEPIIFGRTLLFEEDNSFLDKPFTEGSITLPTAVVPGDEGVWVSRMP